MKRDLEYVHICSCHPGCSSPFCSLPLIAQQGADVSSSRRLGSGVYNKQAFGDSNDDIGAED